MKYGVLLLACIIGFEVAGCRTPVVPKPPLSWSWDFEKDDLGTLPVEWKPMKAVGQSVPGTWEVVGDSWGRGMGLTRSRSNGTQPNILFAINTRLGNQLLTAKVKSVRGQASQGGGIIWRALNEDNYYLAKWNPQQNTLGLCAVVNGKKEVLKTISIKANPMTWHTIAIEHFRSQITVTFDDTYTLTREDDTLPLPGMIGLWTTADAISVFDDIRLVEIK